MDVDALAGTWRSLLGPSKSWVLFENGTCVVFAEPDGDLTERATELLRKFGPVRVGSSAGDFSVITPDDIPGWVVTSHHPDVLTYVAIDEVDRPDDLTIGLRGRAKRNEDGHSLTVVYVEDARLVG
jgi:hypothetical protein